MTIATPSGAHLEPAMEAAKAGKHIICEKPLEVTLERCDSMISACKWKHVLLAGIFPARTGAAVGQLKAAIDSATPTSSGTARRSTTTPAAGGAPGRSTGAGPS